MSEILEMRSLVAVIDAGSFVQASVDMGISKAAVSRHISTLETRLGARLIQRTTRRLSLTSDGELFLDRCRDLLCRLEEAEAELAASNDNARGRLRVNAPFSYGVIRLATLWSEFLEHHPQVRLEVTLADRFVDLVEEGYDLAIRIGALQDSSLISRKLAQTRLIACASPGYLAHHGRPRSPDDLKDHAIIAYRYMASGNEWSFRRKNETIKLRFTPSFESNNGDTCRAAAVANSGITLQPDFIVGADLKAGRLIEVLPDFDAGTHGIYAVFPSRTFLPAKVRVLIDFLQERLSDRQGTSQDP